MYHQLPEERLYETVIVSSYSLLFKKIWEVKTITCKEQEEHFCSNYYTHLCSWFRHAEQSPLLQKSFRSQGWKLMTCCWRKREGNSLDTWERGRERVGMIRKNRLSDTNRNGEKELKQGKWEERGAVTNVWIVEKRQNEPGRQSKGVMGQTRSWETWRADGEKKRDASWTTGTTTQWREQMKSNSRHQKAEYAGQGLC